MRSLTNLHLVYTSSTSKETRVEVRQPRQKEEPGNGAKTLSVAGFEEEEFHGWKTECTTGEEDVWQKNIWQVRVGLLKPQQHLSAMNPLQRIKGWNQAALNLKPVDGWSTLTASGGLYWPRTWTHLWGQCHSIDLCSDRNKRESKPSQRIHGCLLLDSGYNMANSSASPLWECPRTVSEMNPSLPDVYFHQGIFTIATENQLRQQTLKAEK